MLLFIISLISRILNIEDGGAYLPEGGEKSLKLSQGDLMCTSALSDRSLEGREGIYLFSLRITVIMRATGTDSRSHRQKVLKL